MLRAIPRKTSLFQTILIDCFLLLVFAPAYIDERNDLRDPTKYALNGHGFLIAVCIISTISAILFFYFKSAAKTFTIYDDRVEYKFYSEPKQQFLLIDIEEMEWGSRKRSVRTRISRRSEIARGDAIPYLLY
jgi:hypothetical protein